MEKLFDAEYRLMEVLWDHAPVNSTRLVALCQEKLNWNKSTTYTVLRKLKSKGAVRHEDATVSVLLTREQAIRDAEQYAEQDQLRRDAMNIVNDANHLLVKVETAVSKAGKKLDKEDKKQIKNQCAELRKLLSKSKPEKMTCGDISEIRSVMSRLESSGATAIYLAEQEDSGTK